MTSRHLWMATLLTLGSFCVAAPMYADTVQARCDVYPKGEDRATSSGLCTFSQRQGYVGIQLKNGSRVELTPDAVKPNTYIDQNGKPARREIMEGKLGQVYRLATQSIFVYWDPSPYKSSATSPR